MEVEGKRLLVVEDDELLRNLVGEFLETLDYSVWRASDGHDALRALSEWEGPLHAVITDMVLPEHDGVEIAQAAREVDPHCRVLYTSGYPSSVVLPRELSLAESFLQKPIRLSVLASHLRALLSD